MAKATVELSTGARRDYEKLYRKDRRLFERVDRALDRLAEDPQAGKLLHGPLAGRRALRVGPLRIIYRHLADKLLVFVLEISQRGHAYQ
jgi:mRNA-degrading endonuclease RelE of RelBE toxin-antitoxin system